MEEGADVYERMRAALLEPERGCAEGGAVDAAEGEGARTHGGGASYARRTVPPYSKSIKVTSFVASSTMMFAANRSLWQKATGTSSGIDACSFSNSCFACTWPRIQEYSGEISISRK